LQSTYFSLGLLQKLDREDGQLDSTSASQSVQAGLVPVPFNL